MKPFVLISWSLFAFFFFWYLQRYCCFVGLEILNAGAFFHDPPNSKFYLIRSLESFFFLIFILGTVSHWYWCRRPTLLVITPCWISPFGLTASSILYLSKEHYQPYFSGCFWSYKPLRQLMEEKISRTWPPYFASVSLHVLMLFLDPGKADSLCFPTCVTRTSPWLLVSAPLLI